ncbi:MAG: hypothetical protein II369_04760 [Clostridia bacterium]|nr:hypothetical protein [Clostridia bacterium]
MNNKSTPPRMTKPHAPKETKKRANVTLPPSGDRFAARAEASAPSPAEKTKAASRPAPLKRPKEAPRGTASRVAPDPVEAIRKQYGLTEEDTNMVFELGYESELASLVGVENLQKLKLDYTKKLHDSNRHPYRTAFGYRGEEYDGQHHREAILAAYIRDRRFLILRVILTALATLALFFVDQRFTAERTLSGMTPASPWMTPLIGLLILLAAALLSHRQLIEGIRHLVKFSPTPYTVGAVLLPIVLLYDACQIFTAAPMLPANLAMALLLLLTAFCDVLRLSCELRVFRILSADAPKMVLSPVDPRKKKLRRGDKIVKIIHDDAGKNLYRVRSADHVMGFFRRFNSMESAGAPFMTFLIIMLSFAVLTAFAAAIYRPELAFVLSSFMTVLLLCAPLSAVFGYFYSLYRANRLLAHYNCALVGGEAVDEYDGEKTVIFRDGDLLTARKQTEISSGEDGDLQEDLRLCGLLFAKIGGPLGEILKVTRKAQGDATVSILRVQDNGVEGTVDTHRILAGDGEFLRRYGVSTPKESAEKALRRTPNAAPLHVAIDGVLKLSFEIEYECRQDFECLVSDLAEHGTLVALYTYNPNLSDEFLPLCRPRRPDPVSVFRPGRYEEEAPLELADAGAVTLSADHRTLVYPLHAAAGVTAARRFMMRMQIISSIVGTASAVLLTAFGMPEFLGVLPIAGYQLFWILLSLLASIAELNAKALRFRK